MTRIAKHSIEKPATEVVSEIVKSY